MLSVAFETLGYCTDSLQCSAAKFSACVVELGADAEDAESLRLTALTRTLNPQGWIHLRALALYLE